MVKLYAFDLHGVIIDGNEQAVLEQSNLSLEKHGIAERFTIDDIRMLYGRSWADFFRWLLPEAKDQLVKNLVDYAEGLDEKIARRFIRTMDHATDVLKEIRSRGDKIIVISTTNTEALEKYLKWTGTDCLVDDKIGITKDTEQNGKLNVAEDKGRKLGEYAKGKNFEKIVMVGDTEDDIKAGKIAGANTFYFNPQGSTCKLAENSISDLRKVLND